MRGSSSTTFLIVRIQNWLGRRVHSRWLASVLLLYVPLISAGILIERTTGSEVFSRGIILSTVVLAIMPFLIQDAERVLTAFLDNHQHLFQTESEWAIFRNWSLSRFHSPRYMWFGFPWAIGTTLIGVMIKYDGSPFLVKAWASVTYFIILFLSAIGFQGVSVGVAIILKLGREGARFDPYHPDLFGGFEALSRLSARATLYFSIGAFVFPLVFELVAESSQDSELLNYSTIAATTIYVGVLICTFLLPVLSIKRMVAVEKEKALLASNRKLDELHGQISKNQGGNYELMNLQIYYEIYHKRLFDIKSYPYNARVLFELLVAIGLPILVVIVERNLVSPIQ